MNESVRLENGCIYIDEKPTILLCSSLFYFRIPAEYWQERMKQLKQAGYHAIDVYFPWNFHEVAPGEWDFTGMRDVDRFLALAAETGLYVVARPGPYICSEWDGGGMPSWLSDRTGNALRQYNERYLSELSAWMDRIMPIISKWQLGRGGSVVLMQLENELDLFPCTNPRRFVGALARMADQHDFSIPYIACTSSQLDVEMSGGTAPRVSPSYNFYPSLDSPAFEEQMKVCYDTVKEHGQTFMTTETSREHRMLRREILSGLRLVSPYCQSASHDYDCYTAISNWGSNPQRPIAYMTNDYDHGAMLKSDGVVTEEYLEARLLANLVNTLGESLAGGEPFAEHGAEIEADFPGNIEGFNGMALAGGGVLLGVPNLGRETGKARITHQGSIFTVTVPPWQTLLLPLDLPLDQWGLKGVRLKWSALEIGWIAHNPAGAEMVLYGEEGEFCLELPDGEQIQAAADQEIMVGETKLTLKIKPRDAAAKEKSPYLEGFSQQMAGDYQPYQLEQAVRTKFTYPKPEQTVEIDVLEHLGVHRGAGIYQMEVPECKGVLLKGASDILTISEGGRHLLTAAGTGAHMWVETNGGELEVRAEIWGHSCFNAIKPPVVRMGTLRGVAAAYAIQTEQDISPNWYFYSDSGQWGETCRAATLEYPVIMNYGARMPHSTRESGMYQKEVQIPAAGDTRILWMDGCQTPTCVYVDGRKVGEVDPSDPYLDITGYTRPGEAAELLIATVKSMTEDPTGIPRILSGQRIERCRFAPFSVAAYKEIKVTGEAAAWEPVRLAPGELMALRVEIPQVQENQWIRFAGHNVKTTVMLNGYVIGRFFVEFEMLPVVVSGDPNRSWLPKAWLEKDNHCTILVEGMGEGAVLQEIYLDRR